MITGLHAVVFSKKPEADRAFLRDVCKLSHVDVGGGWLIFGLPPSEIAVHPHRRNDLHEVYFMCADIAQLVRAMKSKRVRCGSVQSMPWGKLVQLRLPGGGKLGVYEPRHARPKPMPLPKVRKPAKGRARLRRRAA